MATPDVAVKDISLYILPAKPRLPLKFGTSLVTHMTCVQLDALHLMLGHLLGPLVGAALLAIPLRSLTRRVRRDRGA